MKATGMRAIGRMVVAATAMGLVLALTAVPVQGAVTIYQEGFSGTTGNDLNGTSADTTLGQYGGTAGATWSAEAAWDFTANGKVQITAFNSGRNAFLPFTPQSGYVYTLTATLNNTTSGDKWLALGFSTTAGSGTAFNLLTDTYAWMMLRGFSDGNGPSFLLGPKLTNYGGGNLAVTDRGNQTIRITLDTTGANWTATGTFVASGHSASRTYTANPTGIRYVGFGGYNSSAGTADDFNLTVATHANGVFKDPTLGVLSDNNRTLTINFGTVSRNADVSSFFDIFAEVNGAAGLTAGLDLDSLAGTSGDHAKFVRESGATTATSVAADTVLSNYKFKFDTSEVGAFSGTYTFNLSDEDAVSATTQTLTLNLSGTVAAGGTVISIR